jgi:hypothetical protein
MPPQLRAVGRVRNAQAMRSRCASAAILSAHIAVALAILGVVLSPTSRAQSVTSESTRVAPNAPPSAGNTAADTKARLREAAAAATPSDPQKLKQDVKRAATDAPAAGRFDSDNSACGFLTKPHVRPDGGGLNSHKGGQVLCHQGRLMHCLAGVWHDRGACSAYGDVYPLAWQFEGSDPPGMLPPDGSPDAGHSASPQNPDGLQGPGGPDGGGNGGLMGTSPQSQQLEAELTLLRERESELERQRVQQGEGGARGQQSARAGPDPAKCAELRRTIAQADQAMKQFRDYSRTQRDDGQLSSDVRAAFSTIQSQRNQAQATLNQLGC